MASDIEIALDALRSDAAVWDGAEASLNPPRLALDSLGLTAADVMVYGSRAGLDQTYNDTRAGVQDIIAQAATNFGKIANTLRKAAYMYENAEQQHATDVTQAGETE